MEVELLRFWEARNIKSGELMGVDMIFVDYQVFHSQTHRMPMNTRVSLLSASKDAMRTFDLGDDDILVMFFYGFKPVKTWTPLLNVFRRGILELMYKVQMQFFEDAKLMRGGHYMNLMSSLKPPSSTCSIKETTQRAYAHSVRCEKNRIAPGKHCERIGVAESSGQRVPPGTSPADVQSCVDPDSVQSMVGSTMLQFAKTRKLSIERSELRNRSLLQKREFFHSHRAQPMALEQVLSDRDSEDEVDDDVADFEDRRMLDDFIDVTKDEKQMMHMWNSFVRKQRVLADGHIPWACEAFSRLHGSIMVRIPHLIWCWRMFMVKLWNHGLLDARTMHNCNVFLEQLPN
ncbi:unnamed protein product [Brassica rapa]|uniref:Polycomb protein VEFS-Box domain-containing protein n=2 Tax=Brassica campestris TaxID=3711 RepID=A0A3P6CRS8_BRACM|nr:unnamed protein product [Brassica rapa]VDD17270.1 unnamed protein product [Brassica rapa]